MHLFLFTFLYSSRGKYKIFLKEDANVTFLTTIILHLLVFCISFLHIFLTWSMTESWKSTWQGHLDVPHITMNFLETKYSGCIKGLYYVTVFIFSLQRSSRNQNQKLFLIMWNCAISCGLILNVSDLWSIFTLKKMVQ